MVRAQVLATAGLLAAGCSWVYDADDLRGRGDAGEPDAAIAPDELHIFQFAPREVLEGEGSAADDADVELVRPIPIVIVGQNLDKATSFELEVQGLVEPERVEPIISSDGTLGAFPFRVPILDGRDQDELASLKLSYTDGDVSKEKIVVIRGLGALVQEGGELDTTLLAPRYSHVALSGTVTTRGSALLKLWAAAGISISGTLSASASGQGAGPGGCAGGARVADADCGGGSGKAGETSGSPGGGGGGAFGDNDATAGTGGAGEPGGKVGNAFLVPLPPEGPGPAGGGGGGMTDLGVGGQVGGGSGGVIELNTPAVLRLGEGVLITAGGGDGGVSNLCATAGGGGGGGSGGAILLRAAAALVAGSGARIEAPGGEGKGQSGCLGGNGGVGRIRIDAPVPVELDSAPAAHIAPMLMLDLDPVVRTARLEVALRGAPSTSYNLFLNDGEEEAAVISADSAGVGSAEITLQSGLNTVCVQVAPGASLVHSESLNCQNVAYIPE
jgi:hypothetical protein